MARPRVYVETTVPSFYFETRSEPDMVARRDWTRLLGLYVPALVTPLELIGGES